MAAPSAASYAVVWAKTRSQIGRTQVRIIRYLILCLAVALTCGVGQALAVWSAPDTIENPMSGGPKEIAVDAGGLVHVVYTDSYNTLHWKVRLSTGNWSERWSTNPAFFVHICVDRYRNVYLIWNSIRAGETKMVKYNYTGGTTWTQAASPIIVPNVIGYWPRIKVGPKGYVHALASYGDPNGRLTKYSVNMTGDWSNAAAWSPLLNLDATGPLEGYTIPSLAVDSNDDAHVCMSTSANSGDVNYYRLHNGAVALGPINVSGPADGARSYWPNLDVDRTTNSAYVAIQQNDNYLGMGTHSWLWIITSAGVKTGPFNVSPQNGAQVPYVACRNGNTQILSGNYDACSGGQLAAFVWNYNTGYCDEPITCARNTDNRICKDNAGNDYVTLRNTTDDLSQLIVRNNGMSLGTIVGTVRDGGGALVTGATINVLGPYDFYTTTDANGYYTVPSVYGANYTVTAAKPGYQETPVSALVTNGQTATVNIVMGQAGIFSGYVRDGALNPVGGATVSVTGPSSASVSSNADGSYTILGLAPGSYTLAASKLGYSTDTRSGVSLAASQTVTVNFSLNVTQGTFSGYVRDSAGVGIVGASVSAVGPGSYSTASGVGGAYTLSGVAVGNYTITASKTGYHAQALPGTLSINGPAVVNFALVPWSIGEIKQFSDASTVNLVGKKVSAIFAADGCIYVQDPGRTSGIRVVSPGTGLAVGDIVDVSDVVTTIDQNGHPAEREIGGWNNPATVTRISSGDPPKPLAMNCGAVGGAAIPPNVPGVRDGVGLNNIGLLVKIAGKVTLVLGNFAYIDDGSNIDNGDGTVGVMVEGASPPTVVKGNIVSAIGVIQGNVPAQWTENRRYIKLRDAGDLVLISSNIGTVSGYVTTSNWDGVSGATVSTTSGGYSTTTDGTGAYTLSAVTAGKHTVVAAKSGYAIASEEITLASGQNLSLDLIIDPNTGTLQGLVRDNHSVAIPGATVTTSTGGYTAVTNGSGSYTINSVGAGTYSVTASKTGYNGQTLTGKVVTPGSVTYANFILTASP